jgi:hypothetical protein
VRLQKGFSDIVKTWPGQSSNNEIHYGFGQVASHHGKISIDGLGRVRDQKPADLSEVGGVIPAAGLSSLNGFIFALQKVFGGRFSLRHYRLF